MSLQGTEGRGGEESLQLAEGLEKRMGGRGGEGPQGVDTWSQTASFSCLGPLSSCGHDKLYTSKNSFEPFHQAFQLWD